MGKTFIILQKKMCLGVFACYCAVGCLVGSFVGLKSSKINGHRERKNRRTCRTMTHLLVIKRCSREQAAPSPEPTTCWRYRNQWGTVSVSQDRQSPRGLKTDWRPSSVRHRQIEGKASLTLVLKWWRDKQGLPKVYSPGGMRHVRLFALIFRETNICKQSTQSTFSQSNQAQQKGLKALYS